jgi:hypothetical protein
MGTTTQIDALRGETNYRWDEQLDTILFETAIWTITSRNDQVLGTAPSLRQALDRAASFTTSGAVVVAICRMPADSITVFPPQIRRLQKLCAGRETPILREPIIDRSRLPNAPE